MRKSTLFEIILIAQDLLNMLLINGSGDYTEVYVEIGRLIGYYCLRRIKIIIHAVLVQDY